MATGSSLGDRSFAWSAVTAVGWLLIAAVAGFGFVLVLQTEPTGESWFNSMDNGVNPSLDELIAFLCSFVVSGAIVGITVLVFRQRPHLAIRVGACLIPCMMIVSLVAWMGIGFMINAIRPWGAWPQEIAWARYCVLASMGTAGLVGACVGLIGSLLLMTGSVIMPRRHAPGLVSTLAIAVVITCVLLVPRLAPALDQFAMQLRIAFGRNMGSGVIGARMGAIVGAVVGAFLAELLCRCLTRSQPAHAPEFTEAPLGAAGHALVVKNHTCVIRETTSA